MDRTKVVNALNMIKSGHVNKGVAEIELLLEVPEDFDKIVSAAKQKYGTDDVEIDDEPNAADTENGCWVSAWVFVEREQDEEENQVTDQPCPRCSKINPSVRIWAGIAHYSCRNCGKKYWRAS